MRRLLGFLAIILLLAVLPLTSWAESCCQGRVGDANGSGDDEPTISDIAAIVAAKFIYGTCDGVLDCLPEADVNQSGGLYPTCDDITITDLSILVAYLFNSFIECYFPPCGPEIELPVCLTAPEL